MDSQLSTKDAIRAATCDKVGRVVTVLNLRSGKKGEMSPGQADAGVGGVLDDDGEIDAGGRLEPVPIVAGACRPSSSSCPCKQAPDQPQRAKGLFSCCFPAPGRRWRRARTSTTRRRRQWSHKDVAIDEASPLSPPRRVPSQASAWSMSWALDTGSTIKGARSGGGWQIGDIIMIARADVDVIVWLRRSSKTATLASPPRRANPSTPRAIGQTFDYLERRRRENTSNI